MYGVDDDKKNPRGLAPSLKIMQPARDAQAARGLRNASAAAGVASNIDGMTRSAVQDSMQLGAQENAGLLPPSQGGSVTPLLSPERVTQIQTRQAAPLVAGVNQAVDQSQRVPNGVQLPGINQSLSPMAAQSPLPEPRGLAPQPATPSTADNFANGLAGAGKVAINTAAYAGNVVNDGVRNAAGYLSDGNTDQIQQYRHDSAAKIGEGYDQMATASANLRGDAQQAGRDALGIEKASPSATPAAPLIASANAGELPASAAGAVNPAAAVQAGPASDAPQAQGNGFAPVGLDPKRFGATNDKIVGKVGANGVPEFSNNPADVAGAQGQFQAPTGLSAPKPSPQSAPDGARILASGSNLPAESQDIAGLGRASNIGNGVGTFSVAGQPGDAAKAIATYDRANAIRAEGQAQNGEPRGIKVQSIGQGAPTLGEMQRAKLDARQAQTADIQARGLQAQTNSDREFARNTANDQLNQQKTAQDIQSGEISLQSAQRIEQLRQQLSDPSITGDARKVISDAYATLTGANKDRYMEVRGGKNEDGSVSASLVLDKDSGQFIRPAGAGAAGGAPEVGVVVKGHRFNGGDPKDQKSWSKV